MTDIVRRLREPPFGTETSERNLMIVAADEITRLRAENERLRAALREIAEGGVSDHPPTLWAFARAALEGK
jgi:hypothetical protein